MKSSKDLYKMLVIRILHKPTQKISGAPASILFPGVAIKPFSLFSEAMTSTLPYGLFGNSFGGILSLQDVRDEQKVFIEDGYTNEPVSESLPAVKPAALLGLYARLAPLTKPVDHNEIEFGNDEHVPCITNLKRISDMKRLMDECRLEADHLCYYNQEKGRVYYLNERGEPEEEIHFGRKVLSFENFNSDPEMRKFVMSSYARSVQDFSALVMQKFKGDIPGWLNASGSAAVSHFLKDVENLLRGGLLQVSELEKARVSQVVDSQNKQGQKLSS